MTQPLETIPLTRLHGVGPALAEKFSRLGINNAQDLLLHLPFRYEDRTRIDSIRKIGLGQQVQLQGSIVNVAIQFGRRRSLLCTIQDDSGLIGLRFFHFSATQKNALQEGKILRCYGEVRRGRSGFELYHPEYSLVREDEPLNEGLTPVYPTTEGLQQARLRKIIVQALKLLEKSEGLTELLPADLLETYKLSDLTEAIQLLHSPPVGTSADWTTERSNPGLRRLAFEELLAHRLCMRRFKLDSEAQIAPAFAIKCELGARFEKSLPFTLTNSQQLVASEIAADLARPTPMLRLVQGDVGSGKTVVAALAALQAIESGYQVALMAPTEILAEQHLANFSQWLEPLGITPGWLSGKSKGSARSMTLHGLASGDIKLIIGTHALFQDEVEYHRLGLIIVDEQHRFGVHQRLALREKSNTSVGNPHQLVMTATPIPRTLAMSAYADLDTSVIDELPPGRTPVNTAVLSSDRRPEIVERINKACREGSQAYWVCTLIEESEAMQAQAAEATAEQLVKALPEITVGLIHGRMKPKQKSMAMNRFKDGDIQLLVATTVIEVGVDVPNASLMVIENAERLGLAQLHQLRGRVGRGAQESHCLLLYQAPLSQAGKARLGVMRDSNDGFYIAEKDLELRGPGQVLGTEQTGMMSFRVADIARDGGLLEQVKEAGDAIQQSHPDIIDGLIHRWVGERADYGNV